MNGSERLLTAQELAQYLRVPLSYIRHRCHQKTIPFFKIGNHVRFRLSHVEAWLGDHTVGPEQHENDAQLQATSERTRR